MKYNTFVFLCEGLGPYIKKENICLRVTMPIEERIRMSLPR